MINGKLELLTDTNSILVLVDYQASMFRGVGSGDKSIIKHAAVGAAKAAAHRLAPGNYFPSLSPPLSFFKRSNGLSKGKLRDLRC
jgi:hypothetical protein